MDLVKTFLLARQRRSVYACGTPTSGCLPGALPFVAYQAELSENMTDLALQLVSRFGARAFGPALHFHIVFR